MLIVSPSTATALAPHAASKSWVMFVQSSPPSGCSVQGLILIEGARGADLASRIKQVATINAYEVTLIGLIESVKPAEHARSIVEQYTSHVHNNWCLPTPSLLTFIAHVAQAPLSALLIQTHPGALSEAPVDIDEIARMLAVSVPTVRRLIAENAIPYHKIGRVYRFVPRDVIASLRRAR
jgi:excisionase family DNA binding protein